MAQVTANGVSGHAKHLGCVFDLDDTDKVSSVARISIQDRDGSPYVFFADGFVGLENGLKGLLGCDVHCFVLPLDCLNTIVSEFVENASY